ncbi:MAG: Uma2 family endonuclease, partial [Acidobacteriota bacterium]
MTPERYLEIERAAEFKNEYHDGQMFAMSGGTLAHARIATNFAAALMRLPEGGNCMVVNSDMHVAITPRGPFVYPNMT